MNSKMTFAAASLLLAGVLAVSYGCASSSDESAGGSTGSNSSSGGGSSGGGSSGGGGGGSSGNSSSGAAPSGDSFSFTSGKADGLFTGYGFVAMGAADTVTDPTCDTGKKAITKTEACTTTTNWKESGNGKLCMSGTIPALDKTTPDYTGNWGMQIGVNASEPDDAMGSAMSSYKTVTFTFSGTPSSGIRGLFHRHGDDPATTYPYCMDSIKSGKAYDLVKFNTHCWGTSETGAAFATTDDLPKIDLVGIQISSTDSAEIKVTDFCLEKVEFGK